MRFSSLSNIGKPGIGAKVSTLVTAPFVPTDLSGLQLWVKADGAVYNTGTVQATNGQTVATFVDNSGNGNDLIGHVTYKPKFYTNVQNGLPVIRFVQADGGNLKKVFTLVQPEHVFIVLSQTVWNSKVVLGSSAGTSCQLTQIGSTPNLTTYGSVQGPTTTALAVGTFGIVDAVYRNGANQSHIRVNNGSKTLGNIGTGDFGGLSLGSYANVTGTISADIAEVIIYDSVLSDADATAVNRYLGTKWGITVS